MLDMIDFSISSHGLSATWGVSYRQMRPIPTIKTQLRIQLRRGTKFETSLLAGSIKDEGIQMF